MSFKLILYIWNWKLFYVNFILETVILTTVVLFGMAPYFKQFKIVIKDFGPLGATFLQFPFRLWLVKCWHFLFPASHWLCVCIVSVIVLYWLPTFPSVSQCPRRRLGSSPRFQTCAEKQLFLVRVFVIVMEKILTKFLWNQN